MAVWLSDPKLGLSCLKRREKCGDEKDCASCKGGSGIEFEGEEINGCPFDQITADSYKYLEAYSFYVDGNGLGYPVGGGWQEQAYKWKEAINIIKREIAELGKHHQESPDNGTART